MAVTWEQIDQFNRDGAICIKNAFDRSWLTKIENGMQKVLASPSPRRESMVSEKGNLAKFFIDYYNWQQIPEFSDFVYNSCASEMVGELMQSQYAVFYHEMVLIKEPGVNKITPWHQDMSYYPIEGNKACSIWLPLDPVSKDTTLEFLAGSHQAPKLYHPKEFDSHANYNVVNSGVEKYTAVPRDIDIERSKYHIISWEVQPGDAVIFNMKTLHSSPGNLHSRNRRVFSTRWLGDDCVAAAPKPWKDPMPELKGVNIGDKLAGSSDLPLVWMKQKRQQITFTLITLVLEEMATGNHSQAGKKPIPHLSDYVFTERLGAGTYATVFKAYKKVGPRDIVAVKCVLKSSLNKISTENLLTEIELLKTLSHEHIVQLKDFQWDKYYIYLIMEFCSGGDLSSFLKLKKALHENVVRKFLQQIASALQYMHERHVAHLDLKPQNILMTSSSRPCLKIADFGFAHYIDKDVDTSYLKGSPLYMAPEIVCKRHYNAKADLWSLGVILYECLFGKPPFASPSLQELVEKIKDDKPIEIPYGCEVSQDCRDLVLRLLKRDPEERISFENFFAHSFIELERLPSAQSLPKAIKLVTQAIENDSHGNAVAAVNLYLKALECFVGAMHYESDQDKKDQLRVKMEEYLTRTEKLKGAAKLQVDNTSTSGAVIDELNELAKDHAQLPTVINFHKKAMELEKEGKYQHALDKHKKIIQQFLKLAQDLPESRLREILHIHIQNCLIHAERLDDYIKTLRSISKHRKPPERLYQSVQETCSIQ